MGHKGHYGEYTGNARHSKVTSSNMGATKRDDEAHMTYLKEDINYDSKHGGSDSSMTSDEKHISKLAGDLKYDEKKHGSPVKVIGDRKAHKQSESEYQNHLQSPRGKEEHGSAAKMVSPLHAGTGEKIGKAVDKGLSAISDAAKKYNIVSVTKRALNSDTGKKVKTAVKNVIGKNVTRAN